MTTTYCGHVFLSTLYCSISHLVSFKLTMPLLETTSVAEDFRAPGSSPLQPRPEATRPDPGPLEQSKVGDAVEPAGTGGDQAGEGSSSTFPRSVSPIAQVVSSAGRPAASPMDIPVRWGSSPWRRCSSTRKPRAQTAVPSEPMAARSPAARPRRRGSRPA
jgi:hypothetical protein